MGCCNSTSIQDPSEVSNPCAPTPVPTPVSTPVSKPAPAPVTAPSVPTGNKDSSKIKVEDLKTSTNNGKTAAKVQNSSLKPSNISPEKSGERINSHKGMNPCFSC